MAFGSYGGWPAYVSVAERRQKAAREITRLKKAGQKVAPVVIEGRKIAATFWGAAWCDNLESYRDYANRLPRGRSYVRNNAVIDLSIGPREVRAKVVGSEIYSILITIKHLPAAAWTSICADCAGRVDSLVELLQGKLSKPVMERVCRQGDGLFPKPAAIRFSCSCPDGASLCKHVAAALYGVGARLDVEPELLFRLRAVDAGEIFANLDGALPASHNGGAGMRLDAGDLSDIFGIDLAASAPPPKTKSRTKAAAPASATISAPAKRSRATETFTRHSGPLMSVELVVHPGVDSAFVAWRAPFIDDCRGFALKRRIKRAAGSAASPHTTTQPDADGFVEEIVASWVGFANGPEVEPGTRKPTTEWPIQKYLWSDFMVRPGDAVAYRVVPMIGPADALKEADADSSAWSQTVVIGAETDGNAACYFNRGIVASQWLARLLPDAHPSTKLAKVIATPGDKIRNFLGGPVREKLVSLLTEANAAKAHIYAALFELDDPELILLLQAFRKRAHVVLGNGRVKRKGEDENADARLALAVCDLKNRMTAPRALAHNKFLVVCDAHKAPQSVWTGSTNWTKTGLCTQANNALLVRNPAMAQFYLDQWKALAAAGDGTPPNLYEADATPHTPPRSKGTTLWFTPMHEPLDLQQAGQLIADAKDGILFSMFNPGPRGTLLNDIIELASPASPKFKPDLYIQGVVNQNPRTAQNPVTLFNRGERIDANEDVVLPAAIPGPLKYWQPELLKLPRTHAMVHSKVIVVDPYGANPVVMTGSHNMGPKASGVNDENLILIQGNRDLASRCAGKIMEIYNQYRWRASVRADHGEPWQGLADDDQWQIRDPSQGYDKRRLRELDFWFGSAPAPMSPKQAARQPPTVRRTRPR